MNRRLVAAFRNYLKDLPVALISALSGCLCSAIGIQYLQANHFPNYLLLDFVQFAWLAIIGYSWTVLVLYSLGIYGAAWLLRQFYPRHAPSFRPLSLAVRGYFGLIVGFLLRWSWQRPPTIPIWNTGIWGVVGSVLAILMACQNKEFIIGRRQLRRRIGVPLLLILSLFFFTYTGFPGAHATTEVRDKWGIKTFPGLLDREGSLYAGVSAFQGCKPIVDRVGEIQAVAPTEGPNFFSSDFGSNHSQGEFTLEVVGSKGTGIANYEYSNFNSVSFTFQGKTEKLSCRS